MTLPTDQVVKIAGSEENITAAYIVGLRKDGKLIFQTTGDQAGFIQLLGLHRFAELQLKNLMDTQCNTGDALTRELIKGLEKLFANVETTNESGESKVE